MNFPTQNRDIFREIPLRYLGYANETGESFRHMAPVRVVRLSYALSSGYVLSHALSQGLNTHRTHTVTLEQSPAYHYHHPVNSFTHSIGTRISPTAAFFDTLLWQGLASVVIPGLVINRLCAATKIVLNGRIQQLLSLTARKWVVTVVGISAIPIIIHPIDSAVDKLMDTVVRPLCLRLSSSQTS